MNKDNQNEISTENLNKPIPKTSSSKDIEGKVVHITGRGKFRGKPSQNTPADRIGEDGKEEKYTITTDESFNVEYREEGKQEISNFYVTDIVYRSLGRMADNLDELFKEGKKTGSVVLCKIKGSNGRPYWNIVSEKDYKILPNIVKP